MPSPALHMALRHTAGTRRRPRIVPGLAAALVTATVLGGLVAYWLVSAPGARPLAVPGLVVALLALAVLQCSRAALADDWLRRGAMLAVPAGAAVTLLAFRPVAGCATRLLGACVPVGANPLLLAAGALATLVPVYLDLRRRSVARKPDPIP